ncbi:MAG: MmgE/PrpD family protein, partial [Candidatus Binatia bacterium]
MKAPELSRKLAEFSHSLASPAIPAEVIANAKLAILDCLGVSVLAVSHELGEIIVRLAHKEKWEGHCTIWGSAACAGPRDAAFANASLAHALDYDDGGHVTTYILAASLALGEHRAVAGKTLLEAFVAGREARMSLNAVFSRRFEGMGPG